MSRMASIASAASPPEMLILFPDDWAAYSPTLLRLVDLLSECFSVRACVLDTGRVDNSMLDGARFRRITVATVLARALRKTGLYRPYRALLLARAARGETGPKTQIIAVDADGALAARLLGQRFHLLSLEVGRHPLLRRWVRRHAQSIVIQSKERLHYQFGSSIDRRLPVFYLQNAPNAPTIRPVRRIDRTHPRLIYLGHLIPLHGLLAMLDLVKAWPQASLTLLGLHSAKSMKTIQERSGDLIEAGRVIVLSDYVPESELPFFLANYDIGLCLYELDRRHKHDFNYLSSPAGKMFNYFAAGLPVIASDLPGLNPVTEHGSGVQVKSHEAPVLLEACRTVLDDYPRYSEAAWRAAEHYDFRRAALPLMHFLGTLMGCR